jgi:predicted ATPase
VHSYRLLKDVNLFFKKPSHEYFGDLNLSILVGENGTGKSSILQLLSYIFCPTERGSRETEQVDFTISYNVNNEDYTYNSMMVYPLDYPSKLIVSSFSAFDPFATYYKSRKYRVDEHLTKETKYVYCGPSDGGFSSLDLIIHPILKSIFMGDERYNNESFNRLLDVIGCEKPVYIEINLPNLKSLIKKENHFKYNEQHLEIISEYIRKVESIVGIRNPLKNKSHLRLIDVKDIDLQFLGLYEMILDLDFNPCISDIIFENSKGNSILLSRMSSGEITLLFRFLPLLVEIEDNSLIVIDEPETHLHPKWIQEFVQNLIKIFKGYNTHFIIATHSPLVTSDVPVECIIGLQKENGQIVQYRPVSPTFGGYSNDILKNVFRINQQTGDFSMREIKRIETLLKSGNQEDVNEARKIYNDLSSTYDKFQIFEKYRDLLRG